MRLLCVHVYTGLAIAHERRLDHLHVDPLAAEVDLAGPPDRLFTQTCECDCLAERRRKTAARDLAERFAVDQYFLVTAQHALVLQHEADELRDHALFALGLEHGAADAIARRGLEGAGPCEAGLARRGHLVHVAAVEIHARLEAPRVARTEAGRTDTRRRQYLPHSRGLARGQHDLEAIL